MCFISCAYRAARSMFVPSAVSTFTSEAAIGVGNLTPYVQGSDDVGHGAPANRRSAGQAQPRALAMSRPLLVSLMIRGRPRIPEVITTLAGMIVEVSLEAEASADDRAAVAEVFESAGIQADVKATYIRRSAGLLPWLIVIAVTVRFLWAVPVMKQAGMPGKGSSG